MTDLKPEQVIVPRANRNLTVGQLEVGESIWVPAKALFTDDDGRLWVDTCATAKRYGPPEVWVAKTDAGWKVSVTPDERIRYSDDIDDYDYAARVTEFDTRLNRSPYYPHPSI